ncbi:uncharacterized protein LOC111395322 [Olea europaea var. sylvestris]|uniref:uncharacterized protein LOC111395322 n=1 Tax=Olea europaea var. sylvestris TaxID=158386 RepID=UPI000C1CE3B9|nr:uncharacterized protein LOC111395322 [Olea europaea var. sylvestris]
MKIPEAIRWLWYDGFTKLMSIECIDGLATVLSPQRYEKVLKKEILGNMSSSSPLGTSDDNIKVEGTLSDAVGSRPKKRLRREVVDAIPEDGSGGFIISEGCRKMSILNEGCPSISLSWQDSRMLIRTQYLSIGSQVEVLSQDIGIRGCWFRALIIQRHKDKVKVQHRDIKDATNDAKNLEMNMLSYYVFPL